MRGARSRVLPVVTVAPTMTLSLVGGSGSPVKQLQRRVAGQAELQGTLALAVGMF